MRKETKEDAWNTSMTSAECLHPENGALPFGDAGVANPEDSADTLDSVDVTKLDAADNANSLRLGAWAASASFPCPEEAKLEAEAGYAGRWWREIRRFGCACCLLVVVVGVALGMVVSMVSKDPEPVPSGMSSLSGASPPVDRGDIVLTSYAFDHGRPIPSRYTADGLDMSPPLSWSNLPGGTETLVLICDSHGEESINWVAYDIPAVLDGLDEGVLPRPMESAYSEEARGFVDFYQGPNSWGDGSHGYRGPDPSKRTGAHRYTFTLFALDGELALDPEVATKDAVVGAMKNVNRLGHGRLVGTYQRVVQ